MGAWDYGPFDDDGALDILAELSTLPAVQIGVAMRRIVDDVADCGDYLEVDEVSEAVAVAVAIAGRLGARVDGPDVARNVNALSIEAAHELRGPAARALDRAATAADNEWYELWDEAGRIDEVIAGLAPYRAVLSGRGSPVSSVDLAAQPNSP